MKPSSINIPSFSLSTTLWMFCALLLSAPLMAATSQDAAMIANVLFPTAAQAASQHPTQDLVFGIFIGVMAAAALYLFFIWAVIRETSQLFLMLLLVALAGNMASTNDLIMNAIGPDSVIVRQIMQSYSLILAYIFSIYFTIFFLDIDVEAPTLKKPLYFLAGLLLLLLVYSALDPRFIHFILPTLGSLTISVILYCGAVTFQSNLKGSVTHMVAFTFFLLGGLAGSLYDLGLISTIDKANQLTYTAYSLAAVMFAIVIAGQFAKRQDEKERQLALSNERFALAAKGSNEGLFDWNVAHNEVYFSDQFKRILSINLENEPESIKSWRRMIHPHDRQAVWHAFRAFWHGTTHSLNVEYRIQLLNGKIRWVHTKAVATRLSKSGRLTRMVGSVGDVTLRKQGESALKASEARFRSITEAHPVPVLIASLESGQILYASPGAQILIGLPEGTLLSHRIDRFLTKQDERQDILAALNEGHDVNLKEVTITRGDGNALIAALSARRIVYQGYNAIVIGLYDLTESKEAASKIAKQQEALQQSEKMAALGGLLAGVAHELNNPLSVIVGQSTLLIETAKDAKIATRGEKIFKAADRCSRIVKSFLALARRKPPEKKPVNVNNVINASLELLGYQFRNENVEMHLELDPSLPDIIGDGDQLTQVFTNLELNAAQAMIGWQGRRALTLRTEKTDTDEIHILVADTGPGVPEEIKSRVFEPFFTTKTGTGGTGVGLSLCLNIIEGHGGHLSLETTEGGGASFHITLPLPLEMPAAETTTAQAPEAPQTQHKPLSILIVDDEIELAQTLADLLEPFGHTIDLAANGQIALDKLHHTAFDLIISDLRMPVMDGPTMYAEIAKTLLPYVKKVIFVTGDTLSPHIQAFLSQTQAPVIEKPYRLADIQKVIDRMLKDTPNETTIG